MSAVILDSICCNIYVVHHHIKSFTHQKKEMQSEFSNSEMSSEEESELEYLEPEVQRRLYENSIKIIIFIRWTEADSNKHPENKKYFKQCTGGTAVH